MGLKMSIKWKLVMGVAATSIPTWIVLALVLQSSLDRVDERLFGVLEQRVNVGGAESAVTGENQVHLDFWEDAKTGILLTVHGLIALGILLINFSAFRYGASVAEPILELAKTSRRIAQGDLKAIDEQKTSFVETRELVESYKLMANSLRGQFDSITVMTTKLSGNSEDFANSMYKLTTSASEQAAAVTETAATVEEMEQAGISAAGNARQIVDAAGKTTDASVRGREAVETTNEIILKIKDDSQDIADKSRLLLTAVEEVGNIIRSVNAIAEQSKILAVNASIEAAKAGEYGSGFAVVAQEVKDLAQQSKDATLQITGTLTAIRQAIEMMVETSHSGEARSSEGVATIANAGAIMNDLSEAIRENSDFANVIATNVNQQTIGLTQIATSIEQINSTAYENQNISRRNSDLAGQMISNIEELTNLMSAWKISEQPEQEQAQEPTEEETISNQT